MSLVRKFFVAFSFLSVLLIICVWHSESHLSGLPVVTTVHSYIYAGTLNSPKTKSNIKQDLNEIRQLKTNSEDLIRSKYSENHPHHSTNSSRLSLQAPNNQQLYSTAVNEDNNTSHNRIITSLNKTSTMLAEEGNKLSGSMARAHGITEVELSKAVISKGYVTQESVTTNEAKLNIQSDGLSKNESNTDILVRSLLLQTLKNGTTDTNKSRSLHLETPLVTKPGCRNTGKFPSEESKPIWLNFRETLETYTTFHHKQLQKLKAGNSSVRTLTWSCHDPVKCAGIGDQLYRIQQVLMFAIAFERVLSLHWNPASYETTKYLQPNKIDWTYFNKTQGMHEYHEPELERVKVMDTAKEFKLLYKLLADKSHTHVTVNHELQVPFLRGIFKAIRTNTGVNTALKKIGFTALVMDKKHGIPMNFLSGELLRYLFHFQGNVVDKVDQIQQQLGITDRPYLALHIRTGFLGMKQEEVGHFNSEKIYRNPSDWEMSLTCSVNLAGRLFGQETPIFLATDSSRVKELAIEKYKERFVMINVTLQHVAFTDLKVKKNVQTSAELQENKYTIVESKNSTSPILNIDGVDGYMATWIEFLLLARASAMVHSISGFSSTAAQYCSMHNQYHLPNCK